MENKRLSMVIAGVLGAILLLAAAVFAAVVSVSPPAWIGALAVEISVMTAVAAVGVVIFVVFVYFRSRERE